jgi:tetratricopeptide (TPR) repeat protein
LKSAKTPSKVCGKPGEQLGIAQTLHQLANIEYYKHNYDEAQKLYEKSLALNRTIGNRLGEAMTIHSLGLLAEAQGDFGAAEKRFEEAYQIFNTLGREEDLAATKENLDRVRSRIRSSS